MLSLALLVVWLSGAAVSADEFPGIRFPFCPGQNIRGMGICHASGDPHYTRRFQRGQVHPQGAGSFMGAESKNGQFKVEVFHCPTIRHRRGNRRSQWNSFLVAIAVKTSGHVVSVVGDDVYLDGENVNAKLPVDTPSGLTVSRNRGQVCISAGDKWLDGKGGKAFVNVRNHRVHNTNKATAPNMQTLNVFLNKNQAGKKGFCGSRAGQDARVTHSMLPRSVLPRLCQLCVPDGDCHALQNAAPSPEQSCQNEGVSFEKAERVCNPLEHHATYYRNCIVDFCSEGGDEEAVRDMIEALAEDERLAKPWTKPEDRSAEVLKLVQSLEFHIDDVNDEIEKYEAEEKFAELSGRVEDEKITEAVELLKNFVNATYGMATTQNDDLDGIEKAMHEKAKKTRDEVAVNRKDMHKQIAEHNSQIEAISNSEGEATKVADTIVPELEENRRMFTQSAIEENTHREVLVHLPMKATEKDTESNLQILSANLAGASDAAIGNRAADHQRAQESKEEKSEIHKAIQVFHDGIHDGSGSVADGVVHALQALSKLRRLAAMHNTDEHFLQSDITNLLAETHQATKTNAIKMMNAMHGYGTDLGDLQQDRIKLSRQQSEETAELMDSIAGVSKVLKDVDRQVEESTHRATPTKLSPVLLSSVDGMNETLDQKLQELGQASAQTKEALETATAEIKESESQAMEARDDDQQTLLDISAKLSVVNEAVNNAG